MAACKYLQLEKKLIEIGKVVGNLSYSEETVEATLCELAEVLLQCAKSDESEVRNSCFYLGIVRAILGILRSCSQVSMLTKAAKCVGLLAHGNDDARIKLGELGAVNVLLNLLLPRGGRSSSAGVGFSCLWPREWIPVYEQALTSLRKLTYLNASNQQELARVGGIKLIVELAMDQNLNTNYGHFPPEAKRSLQDLTLRKKFISRVSSVPEEERESVLRSFPALTMHYPTFYVDLVTKEGEWIATSLLEKGVAWPDSTPVPEASKWTCVIVQSVEDALSMWCQFCTQSPSEAVVKMKNSLKELVSPSAEVISVPDPIVGDAYAAFFVAPPISSDLCPPREQWFRVRVLSASELVEVIAVDYGFTARVPYSSLQTLPPQCRGVPPQAVPCRLRGVAPLPASICLLENAAAVIRNMAFETVAFRREILTFKGIETMVKLAGTPSRDVVLQALGGLLNLTVTETLREEVGKRGAIEVAMKLVEVCGDDGDVMEYALSLVLNCTTFCDSNLHLVAKLQGASVLGGLQVEGSAIPTQQKERIVEMVKKILFVLSVKVQSTADTKPAGSGAPHTLSAPSTPKKNSLYWARRVANGERAKSKPVIRYVDDGGEISTSRNWEDPLDPEALPAHGCSTPAPGPRLGHGTPVLLARGCSTPAPGPRLGHSTPVLPARGCSTPAPGPRPGHSTPAPGPSFSTDTVLLVDRSLSSCIGRDVRECVFYGIGDITKFTTNSLKKSVCGILNKNAGGSVFLGVSRGLVRGFKITKKRQDLLCIGLDSMMIDCFSPSILADQYAVRFLPVALSKPSPRNNSTCSPLGRGTGGGAGRGTGRVYVIDDYYVVEIKLQKSDYHQIYTVQERDAKGFKYNSCYCCTSMGLNEKLSFQELRDLVAQEEAKSYQEEIAELQHSLSRFQTM